MDKSIKIVITGAAGSLGQNIILLLREKGYNSLVAIDMHGENCEVLRKLHPDLDIVVADLAESGVWERKFEGTEVLLHLHARITGLTLAELERDNVVSTKNVIAMAKKYGIKYIVHISSSVVVANANDYYTITKKTQEQMIEDCGIPHSVLRPTLMFGWFDKEHFGWLMRFMEKSPVFPVPGDGEFMRQPLYYKDFAEVIISAIERRICGTYGITGKEEITYVGIMRKIKSLRHLRTVILRLPYGLFKFLLDTYALFFKNPPFTSQQLKALAAGDKFEVEPWWDIFGVTPTPLEEAFKTTFTRGKYSDIILKK